MLYKIQRKYAIHSLKITREFLDKLESIIDNINEGKLEIEINIKSDNEESSFESVKDFVESRILPKNLKNIHVDKHPKLIFKDKLSEKEEKENERRRKKYVEFSLNVSSDELWDSYYILKGYDDGKISTCKKQLDNLFNEYKNWYFFLFKLPFPEGTIQLVAGVSTGVFISQKIPVIMFNGINWTFMMSMGIGGMVWYLAKKAYNFFFPFFDLQINKPKWLNIIRGAIGLISLGLIGNFLWEIIKMIFGIS